MKDGKAYFTKKEEEVSNTYLSANGGSAEQTPQKGSNPLVPLAVVYGLGAIILYIVAKKNKWI